VLSNWALIIVQVFKNDNFSLHEFSLLDLSLIYSWQNIQRLHDSKITYFYVFNDELVRCVYDEMLFMIFETINKIFKKNVFENSAMIERKFAYPFTIWLDNLETDLICAYNQESVC
jgi:hypothetical protein